MIHGVFYNLKKSEAVPVFPRPSEPTPGGRVREGVLSLVLVVLVSYSTASTRSGLRALADFTSLAFQQ